MHRTKIIATYINTPMWDMHFALMTMTKSNVDLFRQANLFRATRLWMIIAGTWELPLEGASNATKLLYKFYSYLMFVTYHSLHISFVIKFQKLITAKDTEKAVECLTMMILVYIMAMKMALCRTKKMTVFLKRSIEGIDVTFMGGEEHVTSVYTWYTKYCNSISLLLTIWSFLDGSVLTGSGFADYIKYLKGAFDHKEKPLHVLCSYPFDINKLYGIVISYETFSVYYTDVFNISLQILFNTFMIHIVAEIKVLQYNFRNFSKNLDSGEEVSEEQAYLNFRECIINYNKIIDHTNRLNNELKYVLLVEYGVSSIMLAAVLVQIMLGKMLLFNCGYFGILVFQWGLLSWNANEIVLQSQELAMAIYESNWYTRGKPVNQLILITVLRTRKPLYLSIGPFGEMVIDSAISRLKLAYSFVSVMS